MLQLERRAKTLDRLVSLKIGTLKLQFAQGLDCHVFAIINGYEIKKNECGKLFISKFL